MLARGTGLLLALALLTAPAWAGGFGDVLKGTVERAVKGEVQRKVDQESRRVTRCVLGDTRCVREAEARGDQVETVPATAATAATTTAGAGAAASVDPGGDHPWITPYQGSVRQTRQFDAYTDHVRVTGSAQGRPVTERLEGQLTRLRYRNPQGRSSFEIARNYREALEARGFQVEWACQSRAECGSQLGQANGMLLGIGKDLRYFTGVLRQGAAATYVSLAVTPRYTDLHVLESRAMDTGMVAVDADALAAGLAADGKVTLQGILFDTGRDTLQPASEAALTQVALLLRQQPSLKLRVVGHTDDVGDDASNLALSEARARRVRETLVQRHGVAATRLLAVGMGSHAPVAPNDDEAGRAQNRRVELVKL